MKNLKLTLTFSALFLFFFGPLTQAQEIIFNDATFKKSLVKNKKINTNGNSEIEIWEAMDYEGDINVSNRGILDLTGIEYFTSITKLNVSYNKLEKLDLGSNLALEEVYCNHNKIQKFDVSNLYELKVLQASNNRIAKIQLGNNTKLISLSLSDNFLTELDLTQNTDLIRLLANDNIIKTLDLRENTSLLRLSVKGNGMTSIDLRNGNNTQMSGASIALNNNNLNCINVDDVDYSTDFWAESKDDMAYYSANCKEIKNPNTTSTPSTFASIYPNPSVGPFTLDLGSIQKNVVVEVYNTLGALVSSNEYDEASVITENLSLAAGTYVVNVVMESGKKEAHRLVIQ